ncbi:hypothetical protein KKH27_12475 [bacterium]|nr:hypothetical protein [bacterium]MBU1982814.1 hypothetical protein [bacterium]
MMNRKSSDPAGRSADQAAGRTRELLRQLLILSAGQSDALDRADYSGLGAILDRKQTLLKELDAAIRDLRERGWDLQDPQTYSRDECAPILREAADLSRKLQAHERYLLGSLIALRDQVGERMNAVIRKRLAATGYRGIAANGAYIDAAR